MSESQDMARKHFESRGTDGAAMQKVMEERKKMVQEGNYNRLQERIRNDPALQELQKMALHEGPASYRGRIPEDIFINHFLLYFYEDLKDQEMSKEKLEERKHILEDWIKIAGTPYNEVVVFDRGTNKTLFIVPALTSTRIFNPVRKENAVSFGMIASMAEKIDMVSSIQAQDYQQSRLDEKVKELSKDSHVFIEKQKDWESIFARYREKLKSVSHQDKPETGGGKDTMDDDELLFD